MQVIGNKFRVDFGEHVYQLHFETATQMTYAPILENGLGEVETVQTTMVEIRPDVYMVYWKEKNNATVVHLEDYEKGIVYSNITVNQDVFLNLKGTIAPIN